MLVCLLFSLMNRLPTRARFGSLPNVGQFRQVERPARDDRKRTLERPSTTTPKFSKR